MANISPGFWPCHTCRSSSPFAPPSSFPHAVRRRLPAFNSTTTPSRQRFWRENVWSGRLFFDGVRGRFLSHCSSGSENTESNNPFLAPEDARYLLKFGASCIIGAAVVKYGSLLDPQITRPNLDHALLIILLPVLASIVVLTIANTMKSRSW